MIENPVNIVNLSQFEPEWNWLSPSMPTPNRLSWSHSTTRTVSIPGWVPRPQAWRRAIAANRAAASVAPKSSILVSHGPHMTLYGSMALASRFRDRDHLAYSFNFTHLPGGASRRVMSKAFRSVDRFVCFSNMERRLYADHFDLDVDRFDMIHWAVRPPSVDLLAAPVVAGDYVCAIGSQGRDYETLVHAMRSLPAVRLVIVGTPESVRGLAIPENVVLHCNIPLANAMNILHHSRFTVVPLRDGNVPCGHVTIVSAMHSAKATVASASSGISDYIVDGGNGLTVPPGDAGSMARAIESLWSDPALSSRLGQAALEFAQRYCGEDAAVSYFARYLTSFSTAL